eukprot:6932947-Alexandrium_andersonii.AAC.1
MVVAEIAERGIRDFGITGEVILKSDNEDAIDALRARVFVLGQTPAAYGHESNCVLEKGDKLGK